MNPHESLGENSSLGALCLSFWQQVQYEDKFLFCFDKFAHRMSYLLNYVQLLMLQNEEAEKNY